jgi:GTPase SAR1 family protein
MLVGNKCDLDDERAVEKQMAQEVAAKLKVEFFEASAKSATNVEEIFQKMAQAILDAAPRAAAAATSQAAVRPVGGDAPAGGCC